MKFSFLKNLFSNKEGSDSAISNFHHPSVHNIFGKAYSNIVASFQSKNEKFKSKFNISTEANLILSSIQARARKEYLTAAKTYQVLFDSFEKNGENISKLISHPDIQALLADLLHLYFQAGSYKKCIELYSKYSKALKDSSSISAVAHSHLFLKQYSQALDFYKLYKKQFSPMKDDMLNFYARTKICLAYEDLEKQLRHIEDAIEEEYHLKNSYSLFKPCRQLHLIYANILKNNKKYKKALTEATFIIQNGLIRDEEDINLIKDIYALASKKDEFIKEIKNYNKENPFIYTALAENYVENGFKTYALQTLEHYLENIGYNIYLTKYYSSLSENKVLQNITESEDIFQCNSCGDKMKEYSDECKTCHSFDSIYTITKKVK